MAIWQQCCLKCKSYWDPNPDKRHIYKAGHTHNPLRYFNQMPTESP